MVITMDSYKQIAINALAALSNQEHAVLALTSSNPAVDVNVTAKGIADALLAMDVSVLLVDGILNGGEAVAPSAPKQVNALLSLVSFDRMEGGKLTAYSAKAAVDGFRAAAQMTLLSVENPAESAAAMLLLGCTDGALLAERKKSSRTDKIDQTLAAVGNLGVKPIGFVLT